MQQHTVLFIEISMNSSLIAAVKGLKYKYEIQKVDFGYLFKHAAVITDSVSSSKYFKHKSSFFKNNFLCSVMKGKKWHKLVIVHTITLTNESWPIGITVV